MNLIFMPIKGKGDTLCCSVVTSPRKETLSMKCIEMNFYVVQCI